MKTMISDSVPKYTLSIYSCIRELFSSRYPRADVLISIQIVLISIQFCIDFNTNVLISIRTGITRAY